jgi:Asp-tRNA(Asn)/Glu-tRNA(Gln) amidotransferase A subunit family amidase
MLDILADQKGQTNAADFFGGLARDKKLRIGVANNFRADHDVRAAFEKAIETIRNLGYATSSVAAPFVDPIGAISSIEADRKAISGQAFKDIDVSIANHCNNCSHDQ